ncbi:MAG: SGNH/GDSL hydrolase family protein [Candidatus Sumerlaeota bacterium]|nr:SGNH/GDSL hydrolase family protein [Candidatus Sumerlaeota bacterium]
MKITLCMFLGSIALCSRLCSAEDVTTGVSDMNTLIKRAMVSQGDIARLQHALAKARRGEDMVIGVIGGSITQGAAASKSEFRWGDRVVQWWRDAFPKTRFTFVNAGIGATGSDIAAHRVGADLLRQQPDFVAAEFAVNDGNTKLAAETLEGMARQILKAPNHPTLLLLFTMNQNGGNAQEWHSKIGKHYGLPMISYRDALWPEIEAKRLTWQDISPDTVHPNDRGHKYCADFIIAFLDQIMKQTPDDKNLPPIAAIPAPLISDTFERTATYRFKDIQPLKKSGWTQFKEGWRAEQPGSELEFEVRGAVLSVMFFRIKGPYGIAEARVDDLPPVKLDGWFDQTWGGYTPFSVIARDLGPEAHKLRIKLLSDKAAGSGGNAFEIRAIMAAGLPVKASNQAPK